MAFDEDKADRIRAILGLRGDVTERKMFGGLCFMVGGHMCCGLTQTDLMVRVGRDRYEAALATAHARPMDFTGRPLIGMVYVAAEGISTRASLAKWVKRGVDFASALPPKKAVKTKRRAPARPKPKKANR